MESTFFNFYHFNKKYSHVRFLFFRFTNKTKSYVYKLTTSFKVIKSDKEKAKLQVICWPCFVIFWHPIQTKPATFNIFMNLIFIQNLVHDKIFSQMKSLVFNLLIIHLKNIHVSTTAVLDKLIIKSLVVSKMSIINLSTKFYTQGDFSPRTVLSFRIFVLLWCPDKLHQDKNPIGISSWSRPNTSGNDCDDVNYSHLIKITNFNFFWNKYLVFTKIKI